MTNSVLAVWQAAPRTATVATVIPDGCRDLIVRALSGGRSRWFVSGLADRTYSVSIGAGVIMKGFRFRPGVEIDEDRLLETARRGDFKIEDIEQAVRISPRVIEALDCLAADTVSVGRAAKRLGVSSRSLQRLLIGKTGRPPAYWTMLARLRKSARAVLESTSLAEIAAMHGYADQAHMTRDFKRWLNVTPLRLRRGADQGDQLRQPGYA